MVAKGLQKGVATPTTPNNINSIGHVAEWLRNGLQNRVPRFNSGRGLHKINDLDVLQQRPKRRVNVSSVEKPA
jgi:hypothetical protein